jgi:hypothetical protein
MVYETLPVFGSAARVCPTRVQALAANPVSTLNHSDVSAAENHRRGADFPACRSAQTRTFLTSVRCNDVDRWRQLLDICFNRGNSRNESCGQ